MAKTVLLAARGAESRTAVRSSRRAVLVVLVALGLSIVVAVGLLAFSGQLRGGGPFDSSRLVRYGLPRSASSARPGCRAYGGTACRRYVVSRS